jgi:L-histidine N-alpha-methyltransferase
MHLVAIGDQRVRIAGLGMTLEFRDGDDIWTESSYKFTRSGVEAMLGGAGLGLARWHVDPANYFALALAAPR